LSTDNRNKRIAIVTGGASGIGRSIVERLLSDGIAVAAVSRNPSRLEIDSDSLLKIKTDVTSSAKIKQALDEIHSSFHSSYVDILVNNAGISGPIKPTDQVSLSEWNKTLEVNLTGAFLCSKYAIPKMIASGKGGRIINVSSMVGKNAVTLRSAYSASKMALIGLTRSLSAELGKYGITVNAICPGAVTGDRINEVIAATAKARKQTKDQIRRQMIQRASLRRMTSPEEIAALVSFLVSPGAASVTGQDWNVNSGSGK